MAVHVEAKIVDGLIRHFGSLTLPAGVEVAYPNVAFQPPADTAGGKKVPKPYIRLSVERNTPIELRIATGDEPIRRGFLLAVVCWPTGEGEIALSELAGTIRDHFAFNDARTDRRVISHEGIDILIGIDSPPSVNGPEQGPVYSETPIVIPWHVFP